MFLIAHDLCRIFRRAGWCSRLPYLIRIEVDILLAPPSGGHGFRGKYILKHGSNQKAGSKLTAMMVQKCTMKAWVSPACRVTSGGGHVAPSFDNIPSTQQAQHPSQRHRHRLGRVLAVPLHLAPHRPHKGGGVPAGVKRGPAPGRNPALQGIAHPGVPAPGRSQLQGDPLTHALLRFRPALQFLRDVQDKHEGGAPLRLSAPPQLGGGEVEATQAGSLQGGMGGGGGDARLLLPWPSNLFRRLMCARACKLGLCLGLGALLQLQASKHQETEREWVPFSHQAHCADCPPACSAHSLMFPSSIPPQASP